LVKELDFALVDLAGEVDAPAAQDDAVAADVADLEVELLGDGAGGEDLGVEALGARDTREGEERGTGGQNDGRTRHWRVSLSVPRFGGGGGCGAPGHLPARCRSVARWDMWGSAM